MARKNSRVIEKAKLCERNPAAEKICENYEIKRKI